MALEHLAASGLCGFARMLTGVRAVWRDSRPDGRQRIYFANHRSHLDFLLVWAALPAHLRCRVRPVASAEYWLAGPVRRYFAERVFHGVLIDRKPSPHRTHPVESMGEALAAGDSLIIFPEGTRNLGEALLPFKSGIYHLAQAYPQVELVPVWIENLGRVMPKGTFIPVPLLCSLTFGPAIGLEPGESRKAFLERARHALLALAPPAD